MKPTKLTLEEKQNLIKDYLSELISKKQIKEKYKIGVKSFKKILKEFNIENTTRLIDYNTRKYNVNHDYFKEINTEDKAYFLGLLASDGHISNGYKKYITISLTDLEVIKSFKKSLDAEHPIETKTGRQKHHQAQYRIVICSNRLIENIEKYNLCGNKSHRTHIPEQIQQNLIKHFIRGYFDGDGCIWMDKRRRGLGAVTITSSSLLVLQQIENHLKQNNIIRQEKNPIEPGNGNCFSLRISKREEMLSFLSYIYDNSVFYMKRKFDQYLKLKDRPIRVKNENATNKYFGVYLNNNKYKNKYSAALKYKAKLYAIGKFETEKEAALAYNAKILELGLPEYMLNKVE